jgi:hypothetical protein
MAGTLKAMDDDDISYRLPGIIEAFQRRVRIAGYFTLAIIGAFIVWRISH